MVAQSPQKHGACTATQPKIDGNIISQLSWSSVETTFPTKHQSFLLSFKHWTDAQEPEQLWIRMSLKWLIISPIITESLCCLLDICVTMWASSFTAVPQLLVQNSLFKATGFKNKTKQNKPKCPYLWRESSLLIGWTGSTLLMISLKTV